VIWIGIDPSIEHTGIAVLNINGDLETAKVLGLGVTKLPSKLGDGRVGEIANYLTDFLIDSGADGSSKAMAIIEKPTFENSERGKQLFYGGKNKSKGFNKLCMAAGAAISSVSFLGIDYALVTAYQWKHGTTKPAIKSRVEELFGVRKWRREDEWEAVGLACWGFAQQGSYNIWETNHARRVVQGSTRFNQPTDKRERVLRQDL